MSPRIGALVLLALALAGCLDRGGGAAEAHAEAFGCRKGDVSVAARREVDAFPILFGHRQPPSATRKDPVALDAWKEKRKDDHAAFLASGDVFEAKGCGHTALYFCRHAPVAGSPGCSRLDGPVGTGLGPRAPVQPGPGPAPATGE